MNYAEVVFSHPLDQRFTYRVPDSLDVGLGVRIRAPFGAQKLMGWVVGVANEIGDVKFAIKDIESVMDDEALFDANLLSLAEWIASLYFCSVGEALSAMLPGSAKTEREREGVIVSDSVSREDLPLSDEQRAALSMILDQSSRLSYLFGVTGSGKTEVFLQAARACLESGRSVLYLVPEIALTAQVVESIEARFPGQSAVLHSRLTPSQRLGEWRRIQKGEARLVIGARSAVFAPLERLGLVILDEEHESSYKSSATPRYHARQVAMKRAALAGAQLVMGSATPSLEAWNLMQSGKLSVVRLSKRLSGGAMPTMKLSPIKGNSNSIGKELLEEIRLTKEMGRQTILFLNRRGFAYFYHCKSCGFETSCPRCSTSLTFHKGRDVLMCHYCGYKTRVPKCCPECKSLDLGYAGFGTEKVEEDVAALFPDFRIARLDADSTQRVGVLEKTIDAFRKGEFDLLLGTQMVAKGLNFPGVRLVGIVNADTALNLPDFRSAERSFALLTQVAGRAGRYHDDGLVIVQTLRPHVAPIAFAMAGDFEGFYRWDMEQRKSSGFPPFGRMIRLVFRAKNAGLAESESQRYFQEISARIERGSIAIDVLGPAECPLSRIKEHTRIQLILLSRDLDTAHAFLRKLLQSVVLDQRVYLEIDVDPVSML